MHSGSWSSGHSPPLGGRNHHGEAEAGKSDKYYFTHGALPRGALLPLYHWTLS
jgi:hypothetical protein